MIETVTWTQKTHFFLGVCQKCVRPVRVTRDDVPGRHAMITCVECGDDIQAERLAAVKSEEVCVIVCLGESGPYCSCACGGANHGGNWGSHNVTTTYELESALDKYRAEQAAKAAAKQARHDREARRVRDAFAEWAGDHQDVIDYVRGYDGMSDFMISLSDQLSDNKILSDRQVDAVRRNITRDRERTEREATFRATAKAAPTGKALLHEGVVVHLFDRPGYAYNSIQVQMIVECDGYKIQCTPPRSIADTNATTEGNFYGLKGHKIRFVADVETTRNGDESYAYGKRPRKAEFLDEPPVSRFATP